MLENIKKTIYDIKDVVVNRISLVSKGKRPAVARAETSFSIFKVAQGKINKEQLEKLESISKAYKKKTLYVSRTVINADDLIAFAKENNITDILAKKEMHVTVAFSRTKVVHEDLDIDTDGLEFDLAKAKVEKLGDAIVIKFDDKELQKHWQKYIDAWASWDHETYQPHISLSYNADQDISKVGTYTWKIELWGEKAQEIKKEYLSKLERLSQTYDQMLQK